MHQVIEVTADNLDELCKKLDELEKDFKLIQILRHGKRPSTIYFMQILVKWKPKKREPTARDHCMSEDQFNEFWALYPVKKGKLAAKKRYLGLIPSRLHETILQSLRAQKKEWKDPKFTPHPTTWLNQGRWEDELTKSYDSNATFNKYNK